MSEKEHLSNTLEERKPAHLWNTAMFFPDYHAVEEDSTTQQFLWYFAQARCSIRICIYNFSFPELQDVIFQQHEKRGLIVECIVGAKDSVEALRLKQIPTGVVPKPPNIPDSDQLMHHKFAIIDDEAVLVGSMNWTQEGFCNNKENVCVSTNRNHVSIYLEEFYKLKKICEDAKTFY